jgi:hypothetical protein
VAALPKDAVESARRAWFPDLVREIQAYRTDGPPPPRDEVEDAQPPAEASTPPTVDRPEAGDNELSTDDDLLVSGDDLLADDDPIGGDDLLGSDDDLLADEEIWSADAELFDSAAEADSAPVVELPAIAPEEWAALGGWYLQDFALYYRPVGHADDFMRAWLDVLASSFGGPAEAVSRPVFAALTEDVAPGACAKCHSIDRWPTGRLQVNWTPTRTPGAPPGFTAFSHVVHFSLSGGDSCDRCHRLQRDPEFRTQYASHDPGVFVSNFAAIEKSQCVTCHQPDAAGDSCVQCHRYHVDGVGKTRIATRIAELAAASSPPGS